MSIYLHEIFIVKLIKGNTYMIKTQQKLSVALESLLQTNPLEKITVANICDKAELTRQTFYNYFIDKYDLVNWTFDQLFDRTFQTIYSGSDWQSTIEDFLSELYKRRKFYIPCYQYMGQNSLEAHHYDRVFECYSNQYRRIKGKELDFDELFSLELYCRGAVFMVGQWARNNMEQNPKYMTELFKIAMTDEIQKYLAIVE